VAYSNYEISALVGVKIPEAVNVDNINKATDKAQIIDDMKKSFAHARQAIHSATDLDHKVKLGSHEVTTRFVVLLLATHAHEHLGQAIAYARMNGIVPPWSVAM
jgi:uncharacterized damage-inducible protein DinB